MIIINQYLLKPLLCWLWLHSTDWPLTSLSGTVCKEEAVLVSPFWCRLSVLLFVMNFLSTTLLLSTFDIMFALVVWFCGRTLANDDSGEELLLFSRSVLICIESVGSIVAQTDCWLASDGIWMWTSFWWLSLGSSNRIQVLRSDSRLSLFGWLWSESLLSLIINNKIWFYNTFDNEIKNFLHKIQSKIKCFCGEH